MKFTELFAAGTLAIGVGATPALAEYPERPINMIIPYTAGGATDISARSIAEPLGEQVGEPLIMTNIGGAGGVTGTVAVQNADPDGYSMLFARVGTHSVNPAVKATLPYTLDDFRFVGVYEINPVACAVHPESGIETMDDLIAKARREGVSFSSSGVGSLLHLAGVAVLREFGIENPLEAGTHIPLKGGGEAATAVLTGTVDFVCTNTSALASFVANGQLKPILVTTAEPVAGFDAPSAADLGKPDLEGLVGWTAIAGPAGLPDDVAEKWRTWLAEAVKDEKFQQQMEAAGSIIRLMSPEESRSFIENQSSAFREIVDAVGMRVEG